MGMRRFTKRARRCAAGALLVATAAQVVAAGSAQARSRLLAEAFEALFGLRSEPALTQALKEGSRVKGGTSTLDDFARTLESTDPETLRLLGIVARSSGPGATAPLTIVGPSEFEARIRTTVDGLQGALATPTRRREIASHLRGVSDPSGRIEHAASAIERLTDPVLAELRSLPWRAIDLQGPRHQVVQVDVCQFAQHVELVCAVKDAIEIIQTDDPEHKAQLERLKQELSQQSSIAGFALQVYGCQSGDVCGCAGMLQDGLPESCRF